jgi:hypothetical protein
LHHHAVEISGAGGGFHGLMEGGEGIYARADWGDVELAAAYEIQEAAGSGNCVQRRSIAPGGNDPAGAHCDAE